MIKGGGTRSGGSKALAPSRGPPRSSLGARRGAQMDTETRWTLKRGSKRSAEPGEPHERSRSELLIPVFGDRNHLGIARRFGPTTRSTWEPGAPARLDPQFCGDQCRPPRWPSTRSAARSSPRLRTGGPRPAIAHSAPREPFRQYPTAQRHPTLSVGRKTRFFEVSMRSATAHDCFLQEPARTVAAAPRPNNRLRHRCSVRRIRPARARIQPDRSCATKNDRAVCHRHRIGAD
jgi:hypothetical protein